MMEITLNRQAFLNKLLFPVSKFTDSVILTLSNNTIECISSCTTETKQNTIFYCNVKVEGTGIADKEIITLNIMGIKRLIYALTCIKEDIIKLQINTNHLLYNSNGTTFKFHLKEDGIITRPPLSIEKINQMSFDFTSDIPINNIIDLIKGSNFCNAESSKVYLYIKDDIMYGEITDKSIQNLDTINVMLTSTISGKKFEGFIPITVNLVRLISGIKTDKIVLKINTQRKILLFEVHDELVSLKYVASSLVQ